MQNEMNLSSFHPKEEKEMTKLPHQYLGQEDKGGFPL